ncbi:hypothetical protein TspCOW1_11360 [Thiohalobacter sp. COW1]|uniref:Uncharacterized protein n=1 Tax=Thiohalobacter thiocyanaticus TaxID=585455 RepID=A0A1Z4VQI5_9GAMM|nr:uncharacterized protein FOKN1_1503 [Thiohalobacter thiocyanaticus]BCO31033.1 hypothetical protein TspCOW1_11360 [Thiohalobacter sp. COW1]
MLRGTLAVIPAQAGTLKPPRLLDPRLRGDDVIEGKVGCGWHDFCKFKLWVNCDD